MERSNQRGFLAFQGTQLKLAPVGWNCYTYYATMNAVLHVESSHNLTEWRVREICAKGSCLRIASGGKG